MHYRTLEDLFDVYEIYRKSWWLYQDIKTISDLDPRVLNPLSRSGFLAHKIAPPKFGRKTQKYSIQNKTIDYFIKYEWIPEPLPENIIVIKLEKDMKYVGSDVVVSR